MHRVVFNGVALDGVLSVSVFRRPIVEPVAVANNLEGVDRLDVSVHCSKPITIAVGTVGDLEIDAPGPRSQPAQWRGTLPGMSLERIFQMRGFHAVFSALIQTP